MTYDLGIIKRQRYNPIGSTATTGAITTSFNQNGVNYTAHIFTTTGTLLLSTGVIADYLIVAGGGAGGGAGTDGAAGGGGGGGVTTGTVGLVPNVSYTIAVGQGGVGRSDNTGTVAGNSSISGSGISIVALGGGWGSAKGLFAGAGGSGGGGHQVQSTGGAAGVGTFSSGGGPNTATNYVNAGGASAGNVSAYGSGGGGGAGAAGQAGTTTYGGGGGIGTYTNIINTATAISLGIGSILYSNYVASFNGTNQYLSLASNTGFDQNGIFTCEAWIYPTSIVGGYVWAQLASGFMGLGISSGKVLVDVSFVGTKITSNSTITANSWYHVALVYDGTNTKLYINGALEGTSAGGGAASSQPFWIGNYNNGAQYFSGYIFQFRIVKGVAVYTSAFSVPTGPFTATQSANTNGNPSAAISGVQTTLLTLQNATIIDSSTFGLAITNNGSVSMSLQTTTFGTPSNNIYFAGGGGGSSFTAGMGKGGLGGGAGAVNASGAGAIGSTGTQYTGGGGGAAYSGGATLFGGNGGSGVVIIRYPSFSTASIFSTVSSQALVLQPDSNFKYNSLLLSNLAPRSYQSPLPIEYLVVAGGGASGGASAASGASGGMGGGGAGGFLSGINYLVSSGTYIVTVGAGGTGAATYGANGSNSVFDSITAAGGGGGGGWNPTTVDGQGGGSGGGGSYTSSFGSTIDARGGRKQGNNGSAGTNVTPAFSGGGGGGAGAAAGVSSSSAGGNGGNGKQWVDGNYYAGGGGGGSKAGTTAGTGGLGGGGAGVTTAAGINGLPNTGGGGGGIVRLSLARPGASGGSGIVIIRYSGTNVLAYGGNTTTSGGYTIHTFTESSTILFSGYSPSTTSTPINSTFVDSSYNNNAVNVNFNSTVTQGTFSPYGQNWSTYFNSNLDSLQIPTSTGTSLDLTSSTFTIEAWINVRSLTSQSYIAGVSNSVATSNTSTFDWSFFVTTGTGAISYQSAKGSSSLIVTGGTITTSTWNHVAVSRVGSTATVFVNGIGTTGAVNTITNTNTNIFSIGRLGSFNRRLFNGYISNFRVVKGVTVYATNTNFTPPTSPLPLLTNTVLLACSSNRFIDVSGTTSSFITSGTVAVSRYTPFSPLGTYNKSYNGASVYLNGSTDCLTSYNPSGFLSGSLDFTIEGWYYFTSLPVIGSGNDIGLFQLSSTYFTSGIYLSLYSLSYDWFLGYGVPAAPQDRLFGSATDTPLNSWVHIALVRLSNVMTLYINGIVKNSYVDLAYDYSYTTSLAVGVKDGSFMTGYVSNFRIVNNTALYTSNFTPPTTPLLTIDTSTSTSLLLKFDNASIIDYSGNSTVIPYTTATISISNSQTKFNPYSMYFNGTSNLQIPSGSNPSLNLSTGDFTIEAWIYSTSLQTDNACIISNGAGGGFSFGFTGSGLSLGWGIGSISDYSFAHGMSLNTWYHVALTRNSTNMRMFVNGTQIGVTQSISTAYDLSGISGINTTIGSFGRITAFFVGYIDDLRVTRGIARYTANFGPLANRLQIR